MNGSALYQSYQAEYYHQISVIDSVVSKTRVLLGFVAALIGLLIVVLNRLQFPLNAMETIVLCVGTISFTLVVVSSVYLKKAFSGPSYRYIPLLGDLEKHFSDKGDRQKWLRNQFCECADHNRKANDSRIDDMNEGIKWLLRAVISVILTAIVGATPFIAQWEKIPK